MHLFKIFSVSSSFLGLFPVQNPFRRIEDLRFSPWNIFLLWGIVILLYTDIITTAFSLKEYGLREDSPGSRKIVYYTAALSYAISVTIIRAVAIVYCYKSIQMIQIMAKFRESFPEEYRRKWKTGIFIIFLVILCLADMSYVCWSSSYFFEEDYPGILGLPQATVPARILLYIVDIQFDLSLNIAFCFIIICGFEFIEIQDRVSSVLVHALQKFHRKSWSGNGSGVTSGEDLEKEVGNFPRQFQDMKTAFRLYAKVGGWYMVGVLFFAVLAIINTASSIFFPENDSLETKENIVDMFFGIAIVLILGAFGEFMESGIEKGKERVADAVGQVDCSNVCENEAYLRQLETWANWYSQWNWRSTAGNFFEVNHGLFPAVVTTVLTYFIIMFQLIQSEHDEAQKTSWCSKSSNDSVTTNNTGM